MLLARCQPGADDRCSGRRLARRIAEEHPVLGELTRGRAEPNAKQAALTPAVE
jgi:hypothetical protein